MEPGEPKYQHTTGCLSDQLLCQTNAHVAGLGHLLDAAHVRTALQSIMRHNFRDELWNHTCCQRVYAFQDEAALLNCTWPRGGRPALPFPYADESGWTGTEYHVAAHLFYEGMVEEGLRIVRAASERYDGMRRNPYNEYECGSYYARSMSSHGMLLGLSGFECDATQARVGFEPRVNTEDFSTFWSGAGAWGRYRQNDGPDGARRELHVAYGRLLLREWSVGLPRGSYEVTLNGSPVEGATVGDGGAIVLKSALELAAGDTLEACVADGPA
jgi:hypothetical protein